MKGRSIPRIQPICNEKLTVPVTDQVASFCEGGAEWVQLRLKEASDAEFLRIGVELRRITRSAGALLILDDRVHLVQELEADGVHLGEKDMPVEEARQELGEAAIIGGTADRFERVKELHLQGVDYIGCGPFRQTRTKKELSPLLGLEGYQAIISRMREEGIRAPLLAIGGIRKEDLPSLMSCGVHGIAISSGIAAAEDPVMEMRAFIEGMNEALSSLH